MYNSIEHVVAMFFMLIAFWMGYRAGKKEEKVFTEHIPSLDVINTEDEEKAPQSEDEIRKEMEYARTVAGGFDFD